MGRPRRCQEARERKMCAWICCHSVIIWHIFTMVMPQATYDGIIEKYVKMNAANPFREGNGRSTRVWLDLILKIRNGQLVDWSRADKADYFLAMERSPIKDIESKVLLKDALTSDVNSREVFTKGIDHSCYYEGHTTFEAEEL